MHNRCVFTLSRARLNKGALFHIEYGVALIIVAVKNGTAIGNDPLHAYTSVRTHGSFAVDVEGCSFLSAGVVRFRVHRGPLSS